MYDNTLVLIKECGFSYTETNDMILSDLQVYIEKTRIKLEEAREDAEDNNRKDDNQWLI